MAMPAAEIHDITTTVRVSPSQLMTSPDSGVAMTAPTAMHSKMSPSTPGVTRSSLRTCGIREAQLAKMNPALMKTV